MNANASASATAAVSLASISARGAAERGKARSSLTNIILEAHAGSVVAIIGAQRDGTQLLFDVIEGNVRPQAGRVVVLGTIPGDERNRPRIARVSDSAPLPESLRVEEICALASGLRGQTSATNAKAVLDALNIGFLAKRRASALSIDERRTVMLAIALASNAELVLIEEPLVAIEPAALPLVIDRIRAVAQKACVIVTTASPRDATRIGDRLAVLANGLLTHLQAEHAHVGIGIKGALASIRVVIAPPVAPATSSAAANAQLLAALGAYEVVSHIESTTADNGSIAMLVSGSDLLLLAKAITHAIASARVNVELIEPTTLPLDTIHAAMAARAASPPPGSLPPGRGSLPPPEVPPIAPPNLPNIPQEPSIPQGGEPPA